MEKLVTIALCPSDGKTFHQHGKVEEHLVTYLETGWSIRSITATGAGTELTHCCRLIVNLYRAKT